MSLEAEEFSERLWAFAARIGNVVDAVPATRLGRHVAAQLVRSGTSSAPNYDEACCAESREDFIHKIGVAAKEMRETRGWLRFIAKTALLPPGRVDNIVDEADQLLKMLCKSAKTAKQSEPMASSQCPVTNSQFRAPGDKFPAPSSQPPASSIPGFTGLDHLAIVVPDTAEALHAWRDKLGLSVLYSEVVNNGSVRLTHLDLGNTHLQLVEPLTADHPLRKWISENGAGLHHFCLKVADVEQAMNGSPVPTARVIHQGTQGKRALFLDKAATQNVQVELTGA